MCDYGRNLGPTFHTGIQIYCNSLNNGITLAHHAKEDKVWFDNGKFMDSVFYTDGVHMVDYLQKDTLCDWKVKVSKSVSINIFLNIYNCEHPYLQCAIISIGMLNIRHVSCCHERKTVIKHNFAICNFIYILTHK